MCLTMTSRDMCGMLLSGPIVLFAQLLGMIRGRE
jgi:hypothetical protein